MKTRKHIKEPEFNQIKELLNLGLKASQIAQVVKRSYNTVHHIDQSTDFKAFQQYNTQLNAKSPSLPIKVEVKTEELVVSEAVKENTKALRDLAQAWSHMADKLDEVLETKRPWLARK